MSEQPKLGEFRIFIEGDESRPRRKRYKWRAQRFGNTDKWAGIGDVGWWDVYGTDAFGFPSELLTGHAKTMRDAERAARHALVDMQIEAPADPTTAEPFTVKI